MALKKGQSGTHKGASGSKKLDTGAVNCDNANLNHYILLVNQNRFLLLHTPTTPVVNELSFF